MILKRKFTSYLAFSFLIHGLLFLFYQNQKSFSPQTKDIDKSVEIRLTGPSTQSQSQKSSKNNRVSRTAALPLKSFLPKQDFKFDAEHLQKEMRSQSAGKDFLEVEDLSFYEKIWSQINDQFYFPGVFNQNLISGYASLQIRLKKDGRLDSGFLKVEASNEHVQSFVRTVVIRSLREPLKPSFWLKKKEFVFLDLDFKLDLLHTRGAEKKTLYSLNKDYFYFYRSSFNPNAHPMKKAVPILGPPMVDLVAVYNHVSGREKKLKKLRKKQLEDFTQQNKDFYNSY